MRGDHLILNFANKIAKDVWDSNQSKRLPQEHWIRAKALLTIMHSSHDLKDLKIKGQPSNIKLHKLKRDRREFWRVTIKLPWAITFKFQNGDFSEVKIENYHKG